MANLQPIPTSRFYVEFDGITEKMIKSVTEVNFTGKLAGHDKPVSSTKGGKTLWQTTSSGFEENPNFTVEVFLREGDMQMYNWFKAVMPKSEGGDGNWSGSRKAGAIVGYNSADEEVLRWSITNAWPKSYKVSDFGADKSDLCVETYEIVCEQINRTK